MKKPFGTLLALVVLSLLPGGVALGRLDDATFKDLSKRIGKAMKVRGKGEAKVEWIQKLGEDDQVRSVELLSEWARRSAKLRLKELEPEFEEAVLDLEKFESILKKTVHPWPPKSLPQDSKTAWDRKKKKRQYLRRLLDEELDVRFELARALEKTRDADAIDWIMRKGLKKIRKVEGAENAAQAMVLAMTHADPERVGAALLKEAGGKKDPASRVLALQWIGKQKPEGGLDVAVEALDAPYDAVRRAAVASLRALDDPHAVKPLIDALLNARGVLKIEIEDVLHAFTGESFLSSYAFWLKWWEENGEAWLQGEGAEERHEPKKTSKGGTYFYGLRTDSDRIVFVLDRSGSMKTPASAQSKDAAGGEGGGIEGETKIDVAKSQLEHSIETLPRDVYFNVVFYSDEVQAWQDPPRMLPANEKNKLDAIAWVEKIEAAGSTQLFDGLLKAIEYADNLDQKKPSEGGCDTIFLMSDGSPTNKDGGKPLDGDQIEEAWARVKEANRVFKCIIHTVGVGRGHNRSLLQRIARETGGTYQAVGTR